MRAVIQRVSRASVKVGRKVTAKIGRGLLVLIGVERGDSQQDVDYLAEKVVNLRIFPDKDDRMNIPLLEDGGEILVVSQFTLAGDCRKGRRPAFERAERPDRAHELYEAFIEACRGRGVTTEGGEFRRKMNVSLSNSGPVTLIVSTRKQF